MVQPWQKTLYGNEGYPDNYTDISFLKDLQTNKSVTIFTLRKAVSGVTGLNHQISCCAIFLVIFHTMHVGIIAPEVILQYTTLATFAGYLLFVLWTKPQNLTRTLQNDSKTVISVLIFGFILSPMLHTLTDSISTDTIFTITFFVMTVHIIFFDYGLPASLVSNAISLNAAIFGSICLASRLPSSFHAFTLLVVAAVFFVLLPILTRTLWFPWMMIPTFVVCAYALSWISLTVIYKYTILAILVNLVCPGMYVYQQKYKNNIHGPWDEAIIRDSDMSNKTFDTI